MKALVLNKQMDKFLICRRQDGYWELPGGGLRWGEKPEDELKREILEELNIEVKSISPKPCHFLTSQTLNKKIWITNIVYEAQLQHYNFTPSEECMEIKFIGKEDTLNKWILPNIRALIAEFKADQ